MIEISQNQLRDLLSNVIKNKTISNFIDSAIIPIENCYLITGSKYPLTILNLFKKLKINNIMYSCIKPQEYSFTFLLEDGEQHRFLYESKQSRLLTLETSLNTIEKIINK